MKVIIFGATGMVGQGVLRVPPTYGATSMTGLYRSLYLLTAPLLPLLERAAPKYVTTSDRLGRAMLRAARTGYGSHIVENADLR